ncbi:unnamed protein product, partial [Prorocentrum cordatum]
NLERSLPASSSFAGLVYCSRVFACDSLAFERKPGGLFVPPHAPTLLPKGYWALLQVPPPAGYESTIVATVMTSCFRTEVTDRGRFGEGALMLFVFAGSSCVSWVRVPLDVPCVLAGGGSHVLDGCSGVLGSTLPTLLFLQRAFTKAAAKRGRGRGHDRGRGRGLAKAVARRGRGQARGRGRGKSTGRAAPKRRPRRVTPVIDLEDSADEATAGDGDDDEDYTD